MEDDIHMDLNCGLKGFLWLFVIGIIVSVPTSWSSVALSLISAACMWSLSASCLSVVRLYWPWRMACSVLVRLLSRLLILSTVPSSWASIAEVRSEKAASSSFFRDDLSMMLLTSAICDSMFSKAAVYAPAAPVIFTFSASSTFRVVFTWRSEKISSKIFQF